MVLSMYPHMYLRFPINTIIAWIINDYHEQGNIIITNLLLPLGHISNRRTSESKISSSGVILISSLDRSTKIINARWWKLTWMEETRGAFDGIRAEHVPRTGNDILGLLLNHSSYGVVSTDLDGALFLTWMQLSLMHNPKLLEICPRGNNKLVIIIFPCSW